MIAAEEGGRRLSDDEAVTMAEQLFTAGHGTTRNLIGSAVLALIRNPAEFEKLRENPKLIERAIEEALRYDSQTQAPNPQVATEDVEIGGREISKGEVVTVLIGAANRDPAKFPQPDRFDIARADGEHLAFSTRTGVLEQLSADPDGEVIISVPARVLDVYATVLAIDLASEPIEGRAAIGVVEAGS